MDPIKRRVLVNFETSVMETMRVIDDSSLGIALVVDEQDRLQGTVTDGDIRRAILKNFDLKESISKIMNSNPTTVSPETDSQTVRQLFINSTLKHVPVVDKEGRVLDLVTMSELLSVPLSHPDITDREIRAVLEVLNSTDLSLGPKVVEFEEKMAKYTGRKYSIAVNSGTSGLHLVVKALGLKSGDEVITTPFSFVASSNCLLYENVTPVFVDIEPDTYNIDPSLIEKAVTSRTKAILAVDVFGQPARYDVIGEIAQKYGLSVIADSCESIGAEYRGRRASTYGSAAVFGFYPNKQITTGEGGAVVTDDPDIARLCRSMRNQGREEGSGWLCHERLGYNYRLPEINCALGIVQLERLEAILEKRQSVSEIYQNLLNGIKGIHLPSISPSTTRMSWFVYVIRLGDHYSRVDRDRVLQKMRSQGIGVNSYFPPIHLQPLYKKRFGFKEGDFPVTESVSSRTIALPFHNNLTHDEVKQVVEQFRGAIA